MKRPLHFALLAVLLLAVVTPLALYFGFKISPLSWQIVEPVNHRSGLMMKGYDIVSYFNDAEAIPGDTTRGLKWNNTIWYFASEANKLSFKTFPDRFAPEYGGYCAAAIASGYTADVDPHIWHIENDRLFMFLNESAKADFVDNIANGIIEQADANWSKYYP